MYNSKNGNQPLRNFPSFVTGGLFYWIISRIKIFQSKQDGLLRRALFFCTVAWIPLFALTFIDGTLIGNNAEVTFLGDIQQFVRYLFVIPFLILIENIIDSHYQNYLQSMQRMVNDNSKVKFEKIITGIDTASNSFIPEILSLIVIYGIVIFQGEHNLEFITKWSYNVGKDGINITMAGWYEILVSFPIYQVLIFRWIWRWLLWVYSMFIFTRLELNINAIHADTMAGMEFLNILPLLFGLLALSISAVFASQIGMEIIYQGRSLIEFVKPIIGFVIVLSLGIYFPVFFYIPYLLRARTNGIYRYGGLAHIHNQQFDQKWLKDSESAKNILGSVDNSSLADLNGAYQQAVSELNIIPINFRWLVSTALILLIPFLPLLGTYYSLNQFITRLSEIILG